MDSQQAQSNRANKNILQKFPVKPTFMLARHNNNFGVGFSEMKKFLAILVLGLLWCNVGFANVTGLYSGKLIYPNGDNFPMVSEFAVNNEGEVWGKYSYKYQNKNYKGSFYEGKLEGVNLKIFWTDEFGKGWLKIIFDEKFESFNGEWGVIKNKKEERKEGEWTGKKQLEEIKAEEKIKEEEKSDKFSEFESQSQALFLRCRYILPKKALNYTFSWDGKTFYFDGKPIPFGKEKDPMGFEMELSQKGKKLMFLFEMRQFLPDQPIPMYDARIFIDFKKRSSYLVMKLSISAKQTFKGTCYTS